MPARSPDSVARAARLFGSVGLLTGLLLGAQPARAERGKVSLSLLPAAAVIKTNGAWPWGGGGGLDLRVGVSEALALRLTGSTTAHAVSAITDPATGALKDPGGTLLAFHAGVGVTYTVDILRLVPTIEASLGLLGTSIKAPGGATWTSTYAFGIQLGLGLDYLVTPRWSVGAVLRYHAYLTRITDVPAYLYFGPRITVHFN